MVFLNFARIERTSLITCVAPMSLFARTVVIITIAVLAVGCSAFMSSFQSPFFHKFSLRELVEKNKATGGLNCSPSAGGGGVGTGGGGIGAKQSNFHKGESFSCQLTDATEFDEGKFMQVLQDSIETDLTASNAKIASGKNPDGTGFHLEYTIGDIKGKVQISSKRTMNFYTLNAELDERRGEQ
jgi:hypothetical protein